MSHACLIANPASGRGRGARRLPAVRAAMAAVGITDVRVTTRPGEEQELAERAASEGIETIVAMGGDGTWGNVARGIVASGRDARLVMVEAGTGNDFPHSLGLRARDEQAMARIAVGGGSVRVDMGSVNGVPFLNNTGTGLPAQVGLAKERIRFLSGPLVYVAAALPIIPSYQAQRARVSFDGEADTAGSAFLAIVISNGPRYGGGFQVAPGASVTDGLLDVLTVHDAGTLQRVNLFARARLGTHPGQAEVRQRRVRQVLVEFDGTPHYDTDGELHVARESVLDIRVIPQALRIGVPG